MIFYEQTVIDVLDVGVFLKSQTCGSKVHSHVMAKLYCLHVFILFFLTCDVVTYIQWCGYFCQ